MTEFPPDPRIICEPRRLAAKRPFDVNGGRWAPRQRFMLIQRPGDPGPPQDEELARMHITRDRAESLMAQLTRDHDVAMQTVGGYEVVLDRAKTSHDDFTDLPLLAAQTVEDAQTRARAMAAVRGLTLAFFDWTLREKRPTWLANASPQPPVEAIRRFGRVP